MPNALIDKLSKITKKSKSELENIWDNAILEAKNKKIENKFAYATSILEKIANDCVTLDSQRSSDANNYLTIKDQIITSEGVYPYLGKEIPNYGILGLEPNKTYQIYRPKDEIQKGIETFNNMPLLSDHTVVYYDNLPKDKIIGTLGTDGYYDNKDNHFKSTVTFWEKEALDELDNGKKGLSAAYRYTPVLQSGVYNGKSYDLKMTNLQANHVAHVDNPRDKSAIVNDSANLINKRSKFMNLYTKALMALDGEMDEGSIADAIIDLMQSDSSLDEKKKGLIALLKKASKVAEDNDEDDKEKDKKKVAEDNDEDDKEKDKKKPAMDSATILALATQHVMNYNDAVKMGEKLLGGVNTIALDSADKIYNVILKQNGVDTKNCNFEAKKQMVQLISQKSNSNQSKIAMDSSSTNSKVNTQFDNLLGDI